MIISSQSKGACGQGETTEKVWSPAKGHPGTPVAAWLKCHGIAPNSAWGKHLFPLHACRCCVVVAPRGSLGLVSEPQTWSTVWELETQHRSARLYGICRFLKKLEKNPDTSICSALCCGAAMWKSLFRLILGLEFKDDHKQLNRDQEFLHLVSSVT